MTWLKVQPYPSPLQSLFPGWNLGFCLGLCGTWCRGRRGEVREGASPPFVHPHSREYSASSWGCWEESMNGACGRLSMVSGTKLSLGTWCLLLLLSKKIIWNQSWWPLAFPLARKPHLSVLTSLVHALLWTRVSKTRLCIRARCWCETTLVSAATCLGWWTWALGASVISSREKCAFLSEFWGHMQWHVWGWHIATKNTVKDYYHFPIWDPPSPLIPSIAFFFLNKYLFDSTGS